MTDAAEDIDRIRVVLADANVLYSRVLRDYLLYAADQEIIAVAWSAEILSEVTEHLKENVAGFDDAAAGRLVNAMNNAYPLAQVEPGEEDLARLARLAGLTLPDEDDRHVFAAALAAEATRALHREHLRLPIRGGRRAWAGGGHARCAAYASSPVSRRGR